MSAAEIEKAILGLSRDELEEFAEWWRDFRAEAAETDRERRMKTIVATSGCLMGEAGEDFASSVAEAGKGQEEIHGW